MPDENINSAVLLTRLQSNSYNPQTREVEAIVSTGAPVRRAGYTEVLTITESVRASIVGTPVLDSHRNNGSRNVIGRVISARIENSALVVVMRLSSAPDVEPIRHRIQEGDLSGVSIGYRVSKWRDETNATSGERTRTAVQWQIFEVSIVPVGADPGARIRSEIMPENVTTAETETENVNPSPENRNDGEARRRRDIRLIARSAGLSADWADEQIDDGADVTAARAAAFEAMQTRGRVVIRTHQAGPANDDPSVILTRRTEALAARVNGTAPPDHARQYIGDRLTDHMRAVLALRGISTAGMDQDALIRAAMHTTSDFPNLLTGVGNRTLMPAYQAAQSPLKQLARQTTMSDFRKSSRLRLGEVGPLAKVSEAGEIKHTTRGEAIESYALDTYASIFALSRKAIINDDLGAFRDWGDAAGRAAAETEAGVLAGLLTQANGLGPLMGDSKTLFHASHGNLATPASALSVDSLSAARLAMRQQRGLDGRTPISVAPKFLVVAPDLETQAERVLTEIMAVTIDDANPFGGKLTLLVEARLPAGGWYVFADKAVLPVLEFAYLSSAQGPQMASREGWDVLGTEFRVVLDFGAGALDWRGAYRNPGA